MVIYINTHYRTKAPSSSQDFFNSVLENHDPFAMFSSSASTRSRKKDKDDDDNDYIHISLDVNDDDKEKAAKKKRRIAGGGEGRDGSSGHSHSDRMFGRNNRKRARYGRCVFGGDDDVSQPIDESESGEENRAAGHSERANGGGSDDEGRRSEGRGFSLESFSGVNREKLAHVFYLLDGLEPRHELSIQLSSALALSKLLYRSTDTCFLVRANGGFERIFGALAATCTGAAGGEDGDSDDDHPNHSEGEGKGRGKGKGKGKGGVCGVYTTPSADEAGV